MFLLGGTSLKAFNELKNTALGKMILVRHIGYDTEGSEFNENRLNGWVDYMLLYIKRGTVDFVIDGKKSTANKGEVYIVPPNAKYSFHKNIGCETYFMHFEGDELLKHYNLSDVSYKITAPLEFENIFNKLLLQGNMPMEYRGEFTSIYAMLVLSHIARYREKTENDIKSPQDLALSIINWSFRGTSVIENFARQAGLSEAEFSKLIKEQTGMTPKKYVTYLRIEEIKDKIANSNDKFRDIAFHSGYHDYQYFVKIFKKLTGLTPKEYRKKAKAQRI